MLPLSFPRNKGSFRVRLHWQGRGIHRDVFSRLCFMADIRSNRRKVYRCIYTVESRAVCIYMCVSCLFFFARLVNLHEAPEQIDEDEEGKGCYRVLYIYTAVAAWPSGNFGMLLCNTSTIRSEETGSRLIRAFCLRWRSA